jgi:hypothetical protein
VVAEEIGDRRAAAAIRDVHPLDARARLQELRGEVADAAAARRADAELPAALLGKGEELGDGRDAERGADHQDLRRAHRLGDRREVARRVEGQRGVEARVDRERVPADEDRVAVWRRLGDEGEGDVASGTGMVLDDHRLAERLVEVRAEDAGQHVDAAAGRHRHDEAERPVGIGRLGGRRTAGREGKEQPRRRGEKAAA